MSEYRCFSCGEVHDAQVCSRINVKENPELKEKVKDGSLFVWECPHCGKHNLLQGEVLYHDPDNRLMFFMLPKGLIPEDKEAALDAQADVISRSLEGYVLRRVDEIGSLVEKVNIFDSGLDDCAIEMCKHITKMEMAEKGPKTILDARFKFYRMDGADNDLIFSYPSDGSMQCLKVGFNVYEDCAAILRRNPSVKPSSGFARIDSDWVARFFR